MAQTLDAQMRTLRTQLHRPCQKQILSSLEILSRVDGTEGAQSARAPQVFQERELKNQLKGSLPFDLYATVHPQYLAPCTIPVRLGKR